MSDFEKELEKMVEQNEGQEEMKLPSLDEQKKVVEALKQLEAEGKLTPEVLETYFGKYAEDADAPIH